MSLNGLRRRLATFPRNNLPPGSHAGVGSRISRNPALRALWEGLEGGSSNHYFISIRLARDDGSYATLQNFDFRYRPGDGAWNSFVRALTQWVNRKYQAMIDEYADADLHYDPPDIVSFDMLLWEIQDANNDDGGGCSNVAVMAFGKVNAPSLIRGMVFAFASKDNDCLLMALSVQWYRRAMFNRRMDETLRQACRFIPNLTLKRKDSTNIASVTGAILRDKLGMKPDVMIPLSAITNELACLFCMNIIVYNSDMAVIRRCDAAVAGTTAHIVLAHNHYYLLKDAPRIMKIPDYAVVCKTCFHVMIEGHQCGSGSRNVTTTRALQYSLTADNSNPPVEPAEKLECKDDLVNKMMTLWKENMHILIHGGAGTGKSHAVRSFIQASGLAVTEYVVLTPTNACAIDMCGMTIHRFIGTANMSASSFDELRTAPWPGKRTELYMKLQTLKLIIFDEISMVDERLIEYLDICCKKTLHSEECMGGLQVIFTGDFLQLPPIHGDFLFDTLIWQSFLPRLAILTPTYGHRFTDIHWFTFLQKLRVGNVTQQMLELLGTRCFSKDSNTAAAVLKRDALIQEGYAVTILTGKNDEADSINANCLRMLPGELCEYPDRRSNKRNGDSAGAVIRKGSLGVLRLKVGAIVMCNSNHLVSHGIYNGSVGTVTRLLKDEVHVKFDSVDKSDDFVIAYTKHFHEHNCNTIPLQLGWALSIHKSQGKTLDRVIVTLTHQQSIFAEGQAYVAISRCKSIESLYINGNFSSRSFQVNRRAVEFTQWCQQYPSPKGRVAWVMMSKGFTAEPQQVLHKNVGDGGAWKSVLHNTLFYDFETYFNTTTLQEIPYYNFLIHYYKGVIADEVEYCAMCKDIDVVLLTAKFIMDIVERQCDGINDSKHNEPSLRLCAYNGKSFDFHFLLNLFLKSSAVLSQRFNVSVTMKGTKVVILQLKDMKNIMHRTALEVHDLTNVLAPGTSLANASKEFLGQNFKDVFPHMFINESLVHEQRKKPVAECLTYDLILSNYPKSMHGAIKETDLKNVALHQRLHLYGKNDVEVMRDLYVAIDKLSRDAVGGPILNFITSAKMTWFGFCQSVLQGMTDKEKEHALIKDKPTRKNRYRFHNQCWRLPLFLMTIAEDTEISSCVIGGRCYPRILDFKSLDYGNPYSKITDYYVYLDICSMYVHIMMSCKLPWGRYKRLANDARSLLNSMIGTSLHFWDPITGGPYGIYKVTISSNKYSLEPAFAVHGPGGNLRWSNEVGTIWLTCIDIYLTLSNGGTLVSIEDGYQWEKSTNIAGAWTTKTFEGKDAAAKVGDNAMKSFWKLLGNSCYGAFLQKDYNNGLGIFQNHEEEACDLFLQNHNDVTFLNGHNFASGQEQSLVLHGTRHSVNTIDHTKRPRYMGAFVLSWSRYMFNRIYSIICPVNDGLPDTVLYQPLYGDTDSLMIHASKLAALEKEGVLGSSAGQLTDELEKKGVSGYAKIIQYASTAPKTYAVKAIYSDESMIEKIKTKGIPRSGYTFEMNGKTEDKFTFEHFWSLVKDKLSIQVTSEARLRPKGLRITSELRNRGMTTCAITREAISRSINEHEWSGRRLLTPEETTMLEDSNEHAKDLLKSRTYTVPFGFDGSKLSPYSWK